MVIFGRVSLSLEGIKRRIGMNVLRGWLLFLVNGLLVLKIMGGVRVKILRNRVFVERIKLMGRWINRKIG